MRPAVAVLLALLLAIALGAQVPSSPQQPTFRAGVNFVRVDAYPTLDGKPVADLARDDFEVLEDGVPQRLDSFEHIVVRPRDIAAERVEPRDLRESNQMAADARNRLFVLFLDTYHVTDPTSMHAGTIRMPGSPTQRRPAEPKPLGPAAIDRALVNFLDRAVGPNDLFAAMTPEMDVSTLTFTRRPGNFEDLVKTMWGRRFSWDDLDPEEERWALCYPTDICGNCYPGVLQQMVLRRREGLTLDALRRLVERLGDLREERKAVLLVSEGWALFRPDSQLARPLAWYPTPDPNNPFECSCPPVIPKGKDIYVGSDGQPKVGIDPRTVGIDHQQCDADRSTLAHVDDDPKYRALLDAANRTNTSFYPVDPRGLAVFDTPLDYTDLPYTPPNLALKPGNIGQDAASLTRHLEALRNLASATDGRMTESNDFAGGLRKIAADLSDYYLLGYYSTNVKADGSFRRITVRVKRPGVQVRARRGYLAPTEAELAARRAAANPVDPEMASRDAALGALAVIRSDRPFHLAAGLDWQVAAPAGGTRPAAWVIGEMDVTAAREAGWSSGASVTIDLLTSSGTPAASEAAVLTPAGRSFVLHVPAALAAGEYVLRAKVQGKAGAGAEASGQVRITVPPDLATASAPVFGDALLFRRGPFSGAGFQPTADLRFRRAERVRLDVPLVTAVDSAAVRVLDRRGQPLAVPAAAAQREEDGRRVASGEVALAPLANGDYLIEVSVKRGNRQDKVLTAIRIVP